MRGKKLNIIRAAALGAACMLAGCGGKEIAPPVSSASPSPGAAEESAEPSGESDDAQPCIGATQSEEEPET